MLCLKSKCWQVIPRTLQPRSCPLPGLKMGPIIVGSVLNLDPKFLQARNFVHCIARLDGQVFVFTLLAWSYVVCCICLLQQAQKVFAIINCIGQRDEEYRLLKHKIAQPIMDLCQCLSVSYLQSICSCIPFDWTWAAMHLWEVLFCVVSVIVAKAQTTGTTISGWRCLILGFKLLHLLASLVWLCTYAVYI